VIHSSAEARSRSSALFGNEKVVELVLEMEGHLPTTAQMLSSRTGIAQNLVRAALLKLERAGVLMSLPRLGSRSPLYFDVAPGPSGWSELAILCRQIVAEAERDLSRDQII
jgi:hypothetical protein